jgi:hypothetical protein
MCELIFGLNTEKEARIVDRRRVRLLIGNNHRRANLGDAIELFGEGFRQANATMRRRITRQATGMERDAVLGQPMHVGHRCIVVGFRIVLLFLLQDCEDPRRGLVALLAG